MLCELEGHVQLILPASCGDFNGSMGAVELASHPFFGSGEVVGPFRFVGDIYQNPRTHKLYDSAYSGGCRTPIPIHIGQSFQFKADTCSD